MSASRSVGTWTTATERAATIPTRHPRGHLTAHVRRGIASTLPGAWAARAANVVRPPRRLAVVPSRGWIPASHRGDDSAAAAPKVRTLLPRPLRPTTRTRIHRRSHRRPPRVRGPRDPRSTRPRRSCANRFARPSRRGRGAGRSRARAVGGRRRAHRREPPRRWRAGAPVHRRLPRGRTGCGRLRGHNASHSPRRNGRAPHARVVGPSPPLVDERGFVGQHDDLDPLPGPVGEARRPTGRRGRACRRRGDRVVDPMPPGVPGGGSRNRLHEGLPVLEHGPGQVVRAHPGLIFEVATVDPARRPVPQGQGRQDHLGLEGINHVLDVRRSGRGGAWRRGSSPAPPP